MSSEYEEYEIRVRVPKGWHTDNNFTDLIEDPEVGPDEREVRVLSVRRI
jgi:hypothetical protein